VPAGACRSSREANSSEKALEQQMMKKKLQEREIAEDEEWDQAECT
jgi:hypothetical protein